MTTHSCDFNAGATGLTLTTELFAVGSDTVAYTATGTAEQTNRKAFYRAAFTSVAAGTYNLITRVGSLQKAAYRVVFAGTDAEVVEPIDPAVAASNGAALSTLTQSQVTGGAYPLNSSSFAFNSALPLTTQQKADVTAAVPTVAAITAQITTDHGSGSYIRNTEPDNTTIAAINNKTTNLPSDPVSETNATANKNAVLTRLGTPAGASVSADIAAVLTALNLIPAAVWNVLTSTLTTVGSVGKLLVDFVATVLSLIESSGGHNRFKATALEEAPGGSGLTEQNIQDIADQTALQVASTVTGLAGTISQSAIANGGTLTLKRGDSYVTADGRQKTFSVSGIAGDWSAGTARLWLQGRQTNVEDIAAVTFSQLDDTITAVFDIAATDFDEIPVGESWKWEMKVTLGGTRLNTPIEGKLVVEKSIPTT